MIPRLALPLLLAPLAACGQAEDAVPQASANASAAQPPRSVAQASPQATSLTPRSCTAEIGPAAAQRLAERCRALSPATHPPCNAANSCAMMEEEIARSCALFGEETAGEPACQPDPKSAAAAAAVVARYYRAIDARDYGTAYALWGDDGARSGQTLAAFTAGFAQTRSSAVTLGTPSEEGAAGSLFVTVPVVVSAGLADGRRQRFTGRYVLRRVNDVPGASAEQLRWHIDRAELKAQAEGEAR
jgi:hypothetical protein